MKDKPEAYYGVVTVERPFSISVGGISFRGELALEIGQNTSRKNCQEIADSMNSAFQRGFSEGQATMREMQEKIGEQ